MKYWKPTPGGEVRILPGDGFVPQGPHFVGLSDGSMTCKASCVVCDHLHGEDRRVIKGCIDRMFPLMRANRPGPQEWAQFAFTARQSAARIQGRLR